MKLKTTVKIKIDNKQWKRMSRNLLRSGDKAINVGWWKSNHPSGMSSAQIAKWNEEGHMNGGMFAGTYTPPRPFIRIGFMPLVIDKILPKYKNSVHMIAMGKMTWTSLHTNLSKELVDGLRQTILSWDRPTNSPVTVRLKGFNDPLIETGSLYDTVKAKTVKYGWGI